MSQNSNNLAQCCHLVAYVKNLLICVLSESSRLRGSLIDMHVLACINLPMARQCDSGWHSSTMSRCTNRIAPWWQQRSTRTLGISRLVLRLCSQCSHEQLPWDLALDFFLWESFNQDQGEFSACIFPRQTYCLIMLNHWHLGTRISRLPRVSLHYT